MGKWREWLNNNSAAATLGAVVLLVVCLFVIWTCNKPRGNQSVLRDVWYYDLGSGELFVVKGTEPPPSSAPSGQEAVRAHVFGCGDCSDQNRYIGYLERPSTGSLRTEKGTNWVYKTSPDGITIQNEALSRCTGTMPIDCFPGK